MRLGLSILCVTTLIGAYATALAATQKPARKITENQIKAFINSRSKEYECSSLDQIQIDHLEYFDFMGDGNQEAIVVASTCMTGTAGPDIHAVYARNPEGKLIELPFLDASGDPPPSEQIPVFGNPNYELTVENGELVATWIDASDREDPVIARYKWEGKRFALDRMDVKGPYPTSYDCAKAARELDRAICYSPGVAALDLQLGEAYRRLLQRLPPDKKQQLQSQQRAWLAEREKQCVLYKWWVDCLTDMYSKRMVDLNKLSATDNKH
ncbi:MAG TPA: lysozyme inhibitor LprI family protein [Terracidiphilus sp.]|jgi:uncharacterized protein YecT (DUF1311 family)